LSPREARSFLKLTLDNTLLTERVGRLPRAKLDLLLGGMDIVLGK
jgi:hypothetical protein